MFERIIVFAIHILQNTAGASYAVSEIINAHKTKEQSEHTNKQGLIGITLVLLSSAILIRYMKVYPKTCIVCDCLPSHQSHESLSSS